MERPTLTLEIADKLIKEGMESPYGLDIFIMTWEQDWQGDAPQIRFNEYLEYTSLQKIAHDAGFSIRQFTMLAKREGLLRKGDY